MTNQHSDSRLRRHRGRIAPLAATALAASGLIVGVGVATTTAAVDPSTTATPKKAPSPFARDLTASRPTGLSPNTTTPFDYPTRPIVLRWDPVPGAASYSVEVASNATFTQVAWTGKTDQTAVAPEVLLPDGEYWWRVTGTDGDGVVGLASESARVVKRWPNRVGGLFNFETSPLVAQTTFGTDVLFAWSPLPGARDYDIEVAASDQFSKPIATGSPILQTIISWPTNFPDDGYQWRVRPRDPSGNIGPWSTPAGFTKSWRSPSILGPANNATAGAIDLTWQPVADADKYQVQITIVQNTFEGDPLKINVTTTNTAYAPSDTEFASLAGATTVYWRVRPLAGLVPGPWSGQRVLNLAAPSGSGSLALTPVAPITSALPPVFRWSPITGATLYRVDLATDAQFSNIVSRYYTRRAVAAPVSAPVDNQVGSGYYWRVVWGNGADQGAPSWQVDEDLVPVGTFTKQTAITAAPDVASPYGDGPVLSWAAVDGASTFEVQFSQDPQFRSDAATTIATKGTIRAVLPGSWDKGKRLADGTWYWRVRAIDGSDVAQSWSSPGTFILRAPQPLLAEPVDAAAVVKSPTLTWGAVTGACGYEVQLASSAAFASDAVSVTTAQTAFVPTGTQLVRPGRWYWRVRTDTCNSLKGQWSGARSFTSQQPPDLGLKSVPARVDYGSRVTLAGAVKFDGKPVPSALLTLERRTSSEADFRALGTIRAGSSGAYAASFAPKEGAAYRLRWTGTRSDILGQATFSVRVAPRLVARLASTKAKRNTRVLVSGTVAPARPVQIQVFGPKGWRVAAVRAPSRGRFAVRVAVGSTPGKTKVRAFVVGDRRLAAASSAVSAVLVFDRYVIVRSGKAPSR